MGGGKTERDTKTFLRHLIGNVTVPFVSSWSEVECGITGWKGPCEVRVHTKYTSTSRRGPESRLLRGYSTDRSSSVDLLPYVGVVLR